MKAKVIAKVLAKKHYEFCQSIDNEQVRNMVAKNSIITGGSIASLLLGEKVNDYDIYFTSRETCAAVAQYYVDKYNAQHGTKITVDLQDQNRVKILVTSSGVTGELRMDDVEDTGAQEAVEAAKNDGTYRVLFMSSNAITLSDQIQIIIRFYGDVEEIHKNYDFVHCTNAWTSSDDKLTLRPEALEALLARELRYVGSKYPLCSIIRTRKFIQRNWRINAGQYLKMAMQLNDLDLTNPAVSEDQLIGVDSSHFISLIEAARKHNPEKVDAAYLSNLIDRIF